MTKTIFLLMIFISFLFFPGCLQLNEFEPKPHESEITPKTMAAEYHYHQENDTYGPGTAWDFNMMAENNPQLALAIQILLNKDTWYYSLEWNPGKYYYRFPYGCIRETRHDLEVWKLFRNYPADFLEAISFLIENNIIDDPLPLFRLPLVAAKLVDPILHDNIETFYAYAHTIISCEQTLNGLDLLQEQVRVAYERTLEWRREYLEFVYYDFHNLEIPWQNYVDWTQMPGAGGTIDIMEANIFFRHGGEDLGVLRVMNNMMYGTHGWNMMCLTLLLARIGDDVHDVIISAVVNRIKLLHDEGFETYRVFLDILENPVVFDPRTQEIAEKVSYVLAQTFTL